LSKVSSFSELVLANRLRWKNNSGDGRRPESKMMPNISREMLAEQAVRACLLIFLWSLVEFLYSSVSCSDGPEPRMDSPRGRSGTEKRWTTVGCTTSGHRGKTMALRRTCRGPFIFDLPPSIRVELLSNSSPRSSRTLQSGITESREAEPGLTVANS